MDENARVVREFKMWYPSFYDRTVDCVVTGYHSLLATLEDGTKVEYSTLDNALSDVTRYYDSEYVTNMSEDEWRMEYGRRLKSILRDRTIRQEQLADDLKLSRMMISKYINGKATPSAYNASRIAKALNCDTRELTDFSYIPRERYKGE